MSITEVQSAERSYERALGKVAELENARNALEDAVVMGASTQAELEEHDKKLDAAHERVRTTNELLTRAREAGRLQEEAERREQAKKIAEEQAVERRQRADEVLKYLKYRDEAAKQLSAALALAIEAYQQALKGNEMVKALCPLDITQRQLHNGAIIDYGPFVNAVKNEIFRLSAPLMSHDPTSGHTKSFPGGAAGMGDLNQPEKIKPLEEALHEGSVYLIRVLTETPALLPLVPRPASNPPVSEVREGEDAEMHQELRTPGKWDPNAVSGAAGVGYPAKRKLA